jgi:hypothetical protein
MKEKSTATKDGYSELQVKIKEDFAKFEELRGFL